MSYEICELVWHFNLFKVQIYLSIFRDNNKELILINVKNHAMGVWKFFMFKENGSSHLNIPSLKRYAQIFAMEMQLHINVD